jgi:predicted NUDIX family phosphoesterase
MTNESIKPIKYALTIPKPEVLNQNVYITPSVRDILKAQPSLVDRAVCETDLSTVQLIPYIALVDVSNDETKYFVYTRGKASGEGRLVGKCSIGIGGHMEDSMESGGEPATHIARFARRRCCARN